MVGNGGKKEKIGKEETRGGRNKGAEEELKTTAAERGDRSSIGSVSTGDDLDQLEMVSSHFG